jgi:hypothetical protein
MCLDHTTVPIYTAECNFPQIKMRLYSGTRKICTAEIMNNLKLRPEGRESAEKRSDPRESARPTDGDREREEAFAVEIHHPFRHTIIHPKRLINGANAW